MSDIKSLSEVQNHPEPAIVEIAENILKMVKSGQLRTLVVFGTMPGDDVFTDFYTQNGVNLVGQLEIVKFKILRSLKSEEVGSSDD